MFLRRAWAGAFPSRAVQSSPVLNLYCQRFARFCKMQQPIATDTAIKAPLLLLFYNTTPDLTVREKLLGPNDRQTRRLPEIGAGLLRWRLLLRVVSRPLQYNPLYLRLNSPRRPMNAPN